MLFAKQKCIHRLIASKKKTTQISRKKIINSSVTLSCPLGINVSMASAGAHKNGRSPEHEIRASHSITAV